MQTDIQVFIHEYSKPYISCCINKGKSNACWISFTVGETSLSLFTPDAVTTQRMMDDLVESLKESTNV